MSYRASIRKKNVNKVTIGLIWGFAFIVMDALQYVYFGGLFQQLSSFLFGLLVFGSSSLAFIVWAWLKAPEQLRAAWSKPGNLVAVNLFAALGLTAFMTSVQMIEPAVSYTVGAGVMPLTAWVLYRLGVPEGEAIRNKLEGLGNILIFVGIVFLTLITLGGLSGFVRGDFWVAVLGTGLAIADGVFFTIMLVYCQRLDRSGVGASLVFGIRMPLYILIAGAAVATGIGATGKELTTSALAVALALGLAVTVPPMYALQKAVAAVSTMTISVLTALGPFLVFVLQIWEGRVDYSFVTLTGLFIYFVGAILGASGAVKASVKNG